MRVTQYSTYSSFQRTINDTLARKQAADTRIFTGDDILDIGEDPARLNDAKRLGAIIDRNKQYDTNMSSALNELRSSTEQLNSLSTQFDRLREMTVDASTSGNGASVSALAPTIKGVIEDIVKLANSEFNGKYLYSGTKTTQDSIAVGKQGTNNLPFEMIQGAATAENPSGLSVIYKGNNEDRTMTIDAERKEIVNTKANDMFGEGGVEFFNKAIDFYNTVLYKSDGTKRELNETPSKDEFAKIIAFNKNFSDYYDKVNIASGKIGGIINRITLAQEQQTQENTRLKDFKSQIADTDVAKTSLVLQKETNALQYAVQVGSKIFPQTLLDFLS